MDRVEMPMPVRNPVPDKSDILGPHRQIPSHMWRHRHVQRCCVATTMLCGIMLPTLGAADSQTFASPTPRTLADDPAPEHELSEAQAVAAFATARAWLNEFNAPRMNAPESSVVIDRASAVCIILRRGGKMMGVGIDDSGDATMLRRAVGRAMNETLADPALQSLANAIRHDARQGDGNQKIRDAEAEARLDALRAELGRTLTLELEVAGPRTPLVGATLDALAAKINPGIDGISLRCAQKWSHAFPAQMRLTNLGGEAVRTITNLALNAGISMVEMKDIGAIDDASFYAISTIDLAQAGPASTPVRLFRGEVLVTEDEITRNRISTLADDLAQHILRCRWPEPPEGQTRLPLGFMGDYSPATDQFSPTAAPPLEQALCALALTRYAQLPATDPARAKDAAVAVRQALRDLAEVAPGEADATEDAAACAAMLMVACDMPSCLGDSAVSKMIQAARLRLESTFDQERGFIELDADADADGKPGKRAINPMTRAMIACAWVRLLGAKVDVLPAPDAAVIRAALDAAWESTAEPQRVALLPWIGWAEAAYAQVTGENLAHVEEMQRLASALDRVRVDAKAASIDPDLIGGLALTGEFDDRPRPTAQTLRPAAWLAFVASDSRLTPASQQADAWTGQLQNLRFICQLAVSDLRAATLRHPSRASGGICASVWDTRQPVAAQALGLLTAVETLRCWPKTP